jgi:carbamoylphosphate synthase small subunit
MTYDFALRADNLAQLEVMNGNEAVGIIKDCLRSLTSDGQMEEFLDSYLLALMSYGETEKEAKNYRSRVKAVLKTWKDDDKRNAVLEHQTKSVQLLAKHARGLDKSETGAETADSGVKTEKLLSLGDISAELDRLAQHLQAHGMHEQAERVLVISNEILEPEMEPATI